MAVIICVFASYITEYKKTKIDVEALFPMGEAIEEDRIFKDSEEFLKNYEYFYIYTEKYTEATQDSNGNLINGTHKFKVVSKDAPTNKARSVHFQIKLAANWIGFQSSEATKNNYSSAKGATLTISNIAQIFPAKGKLWFTKVEEPTLYVLVKWTGVDGLRYYTFMELDYEQYSQIPTLPVEPTATPEHEHNH